jgi:16S rRNA (adenine1518-N6/adenine1519-N6)-dimethyltransferase
LCSSRVVDAIAERLSPFKGILEIGPGPGVITSKIGQIAEKSVAIELDASMITALQESAPNVEVFQLDALKTDLQEILQLLPEPRAVVSNLPYYITGPLLTRIAEARALYAKAILMMQKEVAERVLAGPKTSARGSLSVYLQSQFAIERVVSAPAGAFIPPPKVDSMVLEFRPLEQPRSAEFFRLIRIGFGQPRKTLVNNLVAGYAMTREEALSTLARAGLPELARPQEITLGEWEALDRALNHN